MHIVEQQQEGIFIDAYSHDSVSINGQAQHNSLIILPKIGIQTWPVTDIAALSITDSQCFEDPSIEVILIGHQATTSQTLPDNIRLHFARQATGIEVMDIGAACRTYNILASENRVVAAGFIFA